MCIVDLGIIDLNFLALTILYLSPLLCFAFVYNSLPRLATILFIAYLIRLCAMGIGIFITPLPESQSDAQVFEILAWELAQGGTSFVLSEFKSFDTYFVSWVFSWFYLAFGREILFLYGITIIFGTATVWLCWYLSRLILGNSVSYGAAWVCALYPTLILYSVVTLREVFVTFGILLAIIGMLNWFKRTQFRHFIISLGGFVFASFFHGAMLVGLIIYLLVMLGQFIRHLKYTIVTGRLNYNYIVIGIGSVLFALYTSDFQIPKIGFLFGGSGVEIMFELLNRNLGQYVQSSASYPNWLNISSLTDLLLLGPLRIVYFMVGPLPWDVKSSSLLIGCLDGIFYAFVMIGIYRNLKFFGGNHWGVFVIIVVVASYVMIFGLGVSNFGVGYRHRAKLLPILIALYFGTYRDDKINRSFAVRV